MKKWYSIGLLVIAVVLAASFMVACGDDTTETTAAETETTEAMTETTEAAAPPAGGVDVNTIGLYFEELGNNIVKITDVPAPGLQFPVHTTPDDDFAVVISVLDASGAVLGTLETDTGEVDYTEFAATAAKITVTTKAGDVTEYELAM